ncbi:MAG: hypothetical protein QF639_02515 [Rhodospirillales bacterium]|nr:hypothetical protein [Rhodospirillales bacterium]
MSLSSIAPWLVLIGYAGLIWTLAPRRVSAAHVCPIQTCILESAVSHLGDAQVAV